MRTPQPKSATSATVTPPDGPNLDRLISTSELATMLAVDQRSIFPWVASGRLPRPIHLGKRRLRWRLSTVEALMRTLEADGGF
jgi:predicted DNA-binding transcriptional regulator AlpA